MSQMKTVHIRKDYRFEPLVIKPKSNLSIGHQVTTIGTGFRVSKKHKKPKNRNFLRDWDA